MQAKPPIYISSSASEGDSEEDKAPTRKDEGPTREVKGPTSHQVRPML